MREYIKIKCPAKINLDLRVFPKSNDGYHPIKSIMQAINLFDYITIKLKSNKTIALSGDSFEIPYDEDNLCYKAAKIFFEKYKTTQGVEIYLEKHIPVAAGLAGGSTDAAGVLYGLNQMFDKPLKDYQLQRLALELGSDVPFCLTGGTKLCTGRGEKIVTMPFFDFKLTIVKPADLKISAKEAYSAFDKIKAESRMRNDLEFALIKKYKEIQYLHSKGMQMSGSGPAFFVRKENIDFEINPDKYIVIPNLNSISHGVMEI
ncbi:4-(cytidine 5'-diphospho)-2-C-methyl-D-erythritol kinase [bacterium]|nr:4-(cytidine 5'-diphospho)-2-C-methyl-D-erythritol kinase [bacterium]